MRALVFDIGGTYLRSAVAGDDGHLLLVEKLPILALKKSDVSASIWRDLLWHIVQFARQHADLVSGDAPIILAFPGPVDHGRILDAPTLVGVADEIPDLAGETHALTGREVHLLNDISAAAWYFSRVSRDRRFLVVTVSSGVGSKIFDGDHPSGVIDSPPHAGEIGHHVVDDSPDAPVCDCGGRGHLGAIASGRGIERRARQLALAEKRFGKEAAVLTNENHLVPAALAGDAWVINVIRDCTRPLARSILTIAMATGLDRVFVMGGFAVQLGDVYLRLIRALMIELCGYSVFAPYAERLIQLADVSEETGLLGAAVYAGRLPTTKIQANLV